MAETHGITQADPNEPRGHVELDIPESSYVSSMRGKLKEAIQGIQLTTNWSSVCIFKVPPNLTEISSQAIHPEKVSIGPYHCGKGELLESQKYKWWFLHGLLSRTESDIKDYMQAMEGLVKEARSCYSDHESFSGLSDDDFVEMMVLDGCFIIELFRYVCKSTDDKVADKKVGDAATPAFGVAAPLAVGGSAPHVALAATPPAAAGASPHAAAGSAPPVAAGAAPHAAPGAGSAPQGAPTAGATPSAAQAATPPDAFRITTCCCWRAAPHDTPAAAPHAAPGAGSAPQGAPTAGATPYSAQAATPPDPFRITTCCCWRASPHETPAAESAPPAAPDARSALPAAAVAAPPAVVDATVVVDLAIPWLTPIFIRDLLKLENQLPFRVLETLYEISMDHSGSEDDLVLLALKFFTNSFLRPLDVLKKRSKLTSGCKHLLDLFCLSFILTIPSTNSNDHSQEYRPSSESIQCTAQLRSSGIKFQRHEADSFLDINFKNRVLQIPPITITDFAITFFINCMAYEQCRQYTSTWFTTYITFMSCLINSTRDVTFLCSDGIISTGFSQNDQNVAELFRKLGGKVGFNTRDCYLSKQFRDVEAYYSSHCATFMRTHFSKPWSFISFCTAFILLVFTGGQTAMSIWSNIKK